MSTVLTYDALDVFAPTDADGKARGADMGEAQTWAYEIQRLLLPLAQGPFLVFITKAQMDADLAHGPNTGAMVVGDADFDNNGIYKKAGASGTGSWTRISDLLGVSFILAANAGAGSANAIVATTSTGVPSADGGALIALPIAADNTGAVTVSFDGDSSLTIKTSSGTDIPSGALLSGMVVAGYKSGSTLRLLSDIASASIQAAAEAAQTAAEAAAIAATGAVPVADYSALQALDTTAKKAAVVYAAGLKNGLFTFLAGNQSAKVTDDPEQGVYVPPDAASTGSSGVWARVEAPLGEFSAGWFGADPANSDTDNRTALQAAIDYVAVIGGGVLQIPLGVFQFDDDGAHAAGLLITDSRVWLRGSGPGSELQYTGDLCGLKISGNIDSMTWENLTISATTQTPNLVSLTQFNQSCYFKNCYWKNGAMQIEATSATSSTGGSYDIHVIGGNSTLAGTAFLAVNPLGVAAALDQAVWIEHFSIDSFSNRFLLITGLGNGVFISNSRIERHVGASASAISLDYTHKFLLRDCYVEDDATTAIIIANTNCEDIVVEGNYFSVNVGGGTHTMIGVLDNSGTAATNVAFNNNWVSWSGTLTSLINTGASPLVAFNNTFEGGTANYGFSGSAAANDTNILNAKLAPAGATFSTGLRQVTGRFAA